VAEAVAEWTLNQLRIDYGERTAAGANEDHDSDVLAVVDELEEARGILRDVTAVIEEMDPEVDSLRWRQLDRALKHRRWL
jgi:hypothetical protein